MAELNQQESAARFIRDLWGTVAGLAEKWHRINAVYELAKASLQANELEMGTDLTMELLKLGDDDEMPPIKAMCLGESANFLVSLGKRRGAEEIRTKLVTLAGTQEGLPFRHLYRVWGVITSIRLGEYDQAQELCMEEDDPTLRLSLYLTQARAYTLTRDADRLIEITNRVRVEFPSALCALCELADDLLELDESLIAKELIARVVDCEDLCHESDERIQALSFLAYLTARIGDVPSFDKLQPKVMALIHECMDFDLCDYALVRVIRAHALLGNVEEASEPATLLSDSFQGKSAIYDAVALTSHLGHIDHAFALLARNRGGPGVLEGFVRMTVAYRERHLNLTDDLLNRIESFFLKL